MRQLSDTYGLNSLDRSCGSAAPFYIRKGDRLAANCHPDRRECQQRLGEQIERNRILKGGLSNG